MERILEMIKAMSLSGGVMIIAVLAVRFLLSRHLPRRWIFCLWALVALRLLFPVFPENPFSLMPEMSHRASAEGTVMPSYTIIPGTSTLTGVPTASVKTPVLIGIWVSGMLFVGGRELGRLRTLTRRLKSAVSEDGKLYYSTDVGSSFTLGILHPKIYLSVDLSAQDKEVILAHERAHVRRHDPLWKTVAVVLRTVYWFHPLVWMAYHFFACDMELACDEAVLREYSGPQRAAYASVLLAHSTKTGSAWSAGFGHVGLKERLKAMRHYKKPSRRTLLGAGVVLLLLGILFLSQKPGRVDLTVTLTEKGEAFDYASALIEAKGSNLTIFMDGDLRPDSLLTVENVDTGETADMMPTYITSGVSVRCPVKKGELYRIGLQSHIEGQEKTVHLVVKNAVARIEDKKGKDGVLLRTPYLGDVSKTVAIVNNLPFPKGYRYDHIALQTKKEPYGLTVYLKVMSEDRKQRTDFGPCARKAFEAIDNLGVIHFVNTDTDHELAKFEREK